MEKEQKSFRPDGTVEQQPSTPIHTKSGEAKQQKTENGGGKDESESYTDYNGNSEENAPVRSRNEE